MIIYVHMYIVPVATEFTQTYTRILIYIMHVLYTRQFDTTLHAIATIRRHRTSYLVELDVDRFEIYAFLIFNPVRARHRGYTFNSCTTPSLHNYFPVTRRVLVIINVKM